MADVVPFYATVAGIMFLGFAGFLLFERTRVSDVLLLVGAGYLVGPILGVFEVQTFQQATPFIGALALTVILFDGGLGLHLTDLARGLARATVLGVAGFVLTVGLVALVGYFFLGLSVPLALLFGCVIGGTSSVIVIPLVGRIGASDKARVLLTVESALTDVLCVVGALALVTMITLNQVDAEAGTRAIFSQFSIGIVLGLAAGALWTQVMRYARKTPYSYMLTLAAILGLYVATEFAGGNGAISVLLFGIVLGNIDEVARRFDFKAVGFGDDMRRFQGEITFLVRVFFFVYMGVVLSPNVFTLGFLRDGALLLGACLAGRALAARLAARGDPELTHEIPLITFTMPRGLAAAVLASQAVTAGIAGTERFVDWAFAVIVLTNLVATAVAVLPRKGGARQLTVKEAVAPAAAPKEA